VYSQDRQRRSTCTAAETGNGPLLDDCGLVEEIFLTRPSGNQAKAESRHSALLKTAMWKCHLTITALLWELLSQVDGSPALQSLLTCVYLIASGIATNQIKMLYAQAANIFLARGPILSSVASSGRPTLISRIDL
jgi:hypothetical protein